MKPCDCKSDDDMKHLQESGIKFNSQLLTMVPPNAVISIPGATIRISMRTFKRFAEWYLEEQEK